MKAPTFHRPERQHKSVKNTMDSRGRVKVTVQRVVAKNGSWTTVKGNILRSVTLADAKVSQVFTVVNRALGFEP